MPITQTNTICEMCSQFEMKSLMKLRHAMLILNKSFANFSHALSPLSTRKNNILKHVFRKIRWTDNEYNQQQNYTIILLLMYKSILQLQLPHFCHKVEGWDEIGERRVKQFNCMCSILCIRFLQDFTAMYEQEKFKRYMSDFLY